MTIASRRSPVADAPLGRMPSIGGRKTRSLAQEEHTTMPTFDTLSIGEARARSATGKRAALLREYAGYIERVGPGEAGRLELGEGETTQAVRRRLSLAAEALGKRLEIRRTPGAVYFWNA